MVQEPESKAWLVLTVAIISAVAVIIAAIIGLGTPFVEKWADQYFASTSTPLIEEKTQLPQVTEQIEITPTEKPTETPIPPPSPASNFLPSATPTPELETINRTIWATEENGDRVDITKTGVYKVEYIGDAYSPWPDEQAQDYQGWTTIIRIYINREIEWGLTEFGLIGPINFDNYLTSGGYYINQNDAITNATEKSRILTLKAGDFLVFVTLDEKGRYFDNREKVDISITYIGP